MYRNNMIMHMRTRNKNAWHKNDIIHNNNVWYTTQHEYTTGENSALEIRYMYMHIHDSGTSENGLPILLEPPQCGRMAAVPNHSL